MMPLNPLYAARLAEDIYDIKSELRRADFLRVYESDFNVSEGTNLRGKTGALVFLKSEHTMGVAAHGINQYQGQAIVALKGTASGFDALTDLNAGLRRFHTGGSVHQGFYYTFSTFFPQLEQFAQSLSPEIHTIHCVGHSLGGAIATLTADWLASNTNKTVNLYTFGSPRVGLYHFASSCKRRLTEDNIYRVYHRHDPVSMVPTWPFVHVPDSGPGDLQLPSPDALNPIQHHSMVNYRNSVGPNGSSLDWETIRHRRPQGYLEQSMEAWLRSDSVLSLSMNTAWVAGEALIWVLNRIGNLAGITLVVSGSTTFTLLDRLAVFMHKAYQISKEVSFWILRLIKRLAQLIGVTVSAGADITVAFIRMVFLRLHRAVSDLVMRAGRLLN